MKSEPSDVSIDDLAAMPNQTVDWYGVRNYQDWFSRQENCQ